MSPSALLQRLWDANEADYRQQILDLMPAGESLLDVGCDDGSWTVEIARAAGVTAISGMEITDARALAEQKGIDARPADLEQPWPFDDQTFDVVHANQVIEHVKRLDHFVSEVRRVLRPGGHAVICTENLASWHNVAATTLGYMPFSLTNLSQHGPVGNRFALHGGEEFTRGESWQHIHVLTMDGLTDIFEMHGFEICRRFGSGYYPAFGRVGRALARRDPRHTHFIGIVAVLRG
jgi:SAM-dependent methyltransferase